MNITLANIIFTAAGAVISGVAVYIFMKNKFEKKCEEEIESVKKEFALRYSDRTDADISKRSDRTTIEEAPKLDEKDIQILTNSAIAKRYKEIAEKAYTSYDRREKPVIVESKPYKISDDEAGNRYDDVYCYKYYRGDSTLTDENDDPLLPEEIAENIGYENLDLDDEDVIYIRNEIKGCDYEISAVDGAYEEEYLIE